MKNVWQLGLLLSILSLYAGEKKSEPSLFDLLGSDSRVAQICNRKNPLKTCHPLALLLQCATFNKPSAVDAQLAKAKFTFDVANSKDKEIITVHGMCSKIWSDRYKTAAEYITALSLMGDLPTEKIKDEAAKFAKVFDKCAPRS